MIQNILITGAAGFTGAVLAEQLLGQNRAVYAIVRPGSRHNERLRNIGERLHVIECHPEEYDSLCGKITEQIDVFFHLMWTGDKGVYGQLKNVDHTLAALETAAKLGCKRFICTGSQAEYGIVPPGDIAVEEYITKPVTPYGTAKVAACQLSRIRARELGVEWIWGRIFSLIGKYEPRGRMLPDLYHNLSLGREMALSSCRQNWDYLDVHDAADALAALAERGKPGEIYNIANGSYKPLREYTEELRRLVAPDVPVRYGADPIPFISLQPSVEKLTRDTGWYPRRLFEESISDYGNYADG